MYTIANNSYFWVVTSFGKMTPGQGYKAQTLLTLVLSIFLISLFF